MAILVVDLSGAIPEGLVATSEVLASALPDIAQAVYNKLVALAGQRLHGSGEDYVAGLARPVFHEEGGGGGMRVPVAEIVLTGWLPVAVEEGWAGGDMKVALLNGRNAKTDKQGRKYNTVPFRHGWAGAGGNNFPTMGTAYGPGRGGASKAGVGPLGSADATDLGNRVYAAAKKLGATRGQPGGPVAYGDRLPEGLAPILRPHHKTDVYAGMIRNAKVAKRADQTTGYTTFRRVSENSDPAAFMHPGIEGRHLFREVSAEIPAIASFIINKTLEALARGGGKP